MTLDFDDPETWAALGAPVARQFTPEAYLPKLLDLRSHFGITRVGDITGLDRVGLPVVQVCRPGARSNAVTQGKGWTLEAAAVGALLECIEMAAGEHPETLAPWEGNMPSFGPWQDLAPPSEMWPDEFTGWVTGWDIATGARHPVPVDVLDTDFALGAAGEMAPIVRSSIGLGAGASLTEAVEHGLLEAIENDARIRCATPARRALSTLTDARSGPLCNRLQDQGLRVGVWETTRRAGPVCLTVRVLENAARAEALPLPAEGFAARFSATAAFDAALQEALQARLALISGAREDMTQALYTARPDPMARALDWAELALPGAARVTTRDPMSPQDLAQTLVTQDLGPVIAVPLCVMPDVPLAVVRVVVPGLVQDPERLAWAA